MKNMRVPAGLQKHGKALWRRIAAEFYLENEPDELELLFQACKVADQIAELDEAAAEGSMGRPVISPFIAEARVQRGLLAQLLARISRRPRTDVESWTQDQTPPYGSSETIPHGSVAEIFRQRLLSPRVRTRSSSQTCGPSKPQGCSPTQQPLHY